MAIHIEEPRTMEAGFMKTIDESGIMMMFDVLQKYQYAHPVKSTVRELLSNGIDSVTEKNMAKQILIGKAKVEDYFVHIEGELYKDSKFTPDYYNLQWLSDNDKVTINYVEGSHMSKDKVYISDSGVGLGGERLEKYFRLGYSTKRLSKLPLGKFGVGAKSPLSIGTEYYTMESRYNGQLFRFNIYAHTIYSIVPQVNLEKNQENGHTLFNKGTETEYPVYYEVTTEKNGVTIILDAKKHHKKQYIDAVKSQMLYFNNIECLLTSEDGEPEVIDYQAKIMYEDDYIIISDNQYFTQPHLLLNKVNYGLIDWAELELENKQGNIGIKVQPEEVEVNPSRESVLWTDKTKAMVLSRFNDVVTIASGMISKELEETDIVKWLKVCAEVKARQYNHSGNGSVLGRLASIVDLSKVKLKFPLYDKLEYNQDKPLPGLFIRNVEYWDRKNQETGEVKRYIKRTPRKVPVGKIVLIDRDTNTSNRKDKYLLHLYDNHFAVIKQPYKTEEEKVGISDEELTYYAESNTSAIFRNEVYDLLLKSTEVIKYENVVVPDSFTGTDEEEKPEEETVEEKQQEEIIQRSAAERRKLEGKTIVHMLKSEAGSRVNEDGVTKIKCFEFTKVEIPYAELNNWEREKVYYGNDADNALINFIAFITRDPKSDPLHPSRSYAKNASDWQNSKYYRLHSKEWGGMFPNYYVPYTLQHFFDSPIKLIKVAQSSNQYYRDFNKVQQFFTVIKNKTITMSNQLIQWNTARVIREKLVDAAFLYNFQQFNPLYSTMYHKLCDYVDKHYREVGDYAKNNLYGLNEVTYDDLLRHLNNVQRFQEFVMSNHSDPKAISDLAGQLFMGNTGIQDGMAVDPEIMSMTSQVLEYAQSCGDMLNWIPTLTGYSGWSRMLEYNSDKQSRAIDSELAMEIVEYLKYREVPAYTEQEQKQREVLVTHEQELSETEQ